VNVVGHTEGKYGGMGKWRYGDENRELGLIEREQREPEI